jgi:hypothetical protein
VKMLTHVHKVVNTCWCWHIAKVVKFEWWRRVWDPLPLPPLKLGRIRRFSGSKTVIFSLTGRSPWVTGRVWSILVARAEEQTVWCTDRTLRASGRVRPDVSGHEYHAREPL